MQRTMLNEQINIFTKQENFLNADFLLNLKKKLNSRIEQRKTQKKY